MSAIQKGIYRHYSGKEYEVMGIAKHSETLEDFVLYKPLYRESIADYWVRPVAMFGEEIEVNGIKQKRFTYIEETQKNQKVGIDYTGITTNFICHDGNGKFLFSKRGIASIDEVGTWQFGGGKLQFTEEPDSGVLRELYEELGVSREFAEKFIGTTNLVREHEGRPTHWICFSYVFKVDPHEINNLEPHKIDEIGWYTLDRIPSPMHKGTSILLKKYKTILESI